MSELSKKRSRGDTVAVTFESRKQFKSSQNPNPNGSAVKFQKRSSETSGHTRHRIWHAGEREFGDQVEQNVPNHVQIQKRSRGVAPISVTSFDGSESGDASSHLHSSGTKTATNSVTDYSQAENQVVYEEALSRTSCVGIGISKSNTAATICACGGSDPTLYQKLVECANLHCKIGRYHAACVGLANRTPAPTWICRDCRQPPAPGSNDENTINPQVTPWPTEPPLSAQQASVVKLITQGGRNVCYTGSAGTGKSTVLKAAVKALRRQGKKVDIVAPSGIAALAVSGQTTFVYAGWTPDTFKVNLAGIAKRALGTTIRRRLCKTDVLIIEEISMVDSHVFERLERSCREARAAGQWDREIETSTHSLYRHDLPFGGMQVIVTGDFCQLPPVRPFKYCLYCGGDELPGWRSNKGQPLTCPRCHRTYEDKDKWAFQNDAWKSCNFAYVELTEIHRQDDKTFVDILQKCRLCIPLSQHDKMTLLHHPCNTKDAVHLRPTLAEVQRINDDQFRRLPGSARSYGCLDMFKWNKELHPELQSRQWRKTEGRYEGRNDGPLKALQDHRLEEYLQLKIDTLVILLVNLNIDAGLVNGTQGKVVGFQPYSADGDPNPVGQPSSYLPEVIGEYGPLRLAQVQEFATSRNLKDWPVVQFNNGLTQIIYAQCQVSALGGDKPYSLIGRTQIPLLPAWAITVHKSQGMTLTRVEVDLSRAFEREMIYVALSRCKTLEGLKVHQLPRAMDHGPNLVVQEFLRNFKSAATLSSRPRKTVVHASHGSNANPIVLE